MPAYESEPARTRYSPALRQVWWTSVPLWSIGILSFVPFLAFALIHRRKRDWAVFAAYLAASVAMVVTVAAVRSDTDPGAAAGGFLIVLAACGAVHAAVLFRPSRSLTGTDQRGVRPAARSALLSVRRRNRDAVRQAHHRIERRREARHLVSADPVMARDLRIGRPELPRDYDDGGLVDVNEVPETVLTAQLGLTPAEASDVLAALGKFTSADELCAYTQLSPGRVDELRDLMIFS